MTAIGNKDWVGSKNWHFGAFGGPGTASQQPTIPRGAGFQARGRARRFSEPFCMVVQCGPRFKLALTTGEERFGCLSPVCGDIPFHKMKNLPAAATAQTSWISVIRYYSIIPLRQIEKKVLLKNVKVDTSPSDCSARNKRAKTHELLVTSCGNHCTCKGQNTLFIICQSYFDACIQKFLTNFFVSQERFSLALGCS